MNHRRMFLHPGVFHECQEHGPTTVFIVREVSGLLAEDLIVEGEQ